MNHPRSLSAALFRLLLLAALLPVWTGCTPKETVPRTLRVVTWNLRWFPGGFPDAGPEEAARQMVAAQDALRPLKADVLLLQEVRDLAAARELVGAVEEKASVHVTSRFVSTPQNQVIAATLPAEAAWASEWKTGTVTPPRGYAFAVINLPGGQRLLVWCLHLKSNRGDLARSIAERRESCAQLLAHMQEMVGLYEPLGPYAILIGGDFNTSLEDERFADEPTLRALQAAGLDWCFADVPFARRITIAATKEYPENTFDHIFTSGLGAPRASASTDPRVSDHAAVVMEIDLEKASFNPKVDFTAAAAVLAKATGELTKTAAAAGDALRASDDEAIRAALGSRQAIRGRVRRIGYSDRAGISFIEFEGNERGNFVGILRDQNRDAVLKALGGAELVEMLEGREIEIRGEITSYRNTPQIEVTEAGQITVVRPGRAEN